MNGRTSLGGDAPAADAAREAARAAEPIRVDLMPGLYDRLGATARARVPSRSPRWFSYLRNRGQRLVRLGEKGFGAHRGSRGLRHPEVGRYVAQLRHPLELGADR